mmetsp:Transcript_76373/g.184805  ORF Transcript_76373/g.184805 Transcript_76373/m.184805 type:complete len:274 (+) Transcript_76373:3611-4432(+)
MTRPSPRSGWKSARGCPTWASSPPPRPRAGRRRWDPEGRGSPAARSSAWPSAAPSSGTPRCCSWTRPRALWTARASASCRRPWRQRARAGRRSRSRTASPRFGIATSSWSWPRGQSSRRARTRSCWTPTACTPSSTTARATRRAAKAPQTSSRSPIPRSRPPPPRAPARPRGWGSAPRTPRTARPQKRPTRPASSCWRRTVRGTPAAAGVHCEQDGLNRTRVNANTSEAKRFELHKPHHRKPVAGCSPRCPHLGAVCKSHCSHQARDPKASWW